MTSSGGCACGAVRYTVDGPIDDVAHCHCGLCRRHGGIVTTWATVPQTTFRWTAGVPIAWRSTPHGHRYVCGTCGSLLALITSRSPVTIDLTIGTLDAPEAHPADRHIWVRDRLSWLSLDPSLPEQTEETP
ncbi:MAG: GFA family protein [Myxococcota bacterium]